MYDNDATYLHPVPENEDYGIVELEESNQLIRELAALKWSRAKRRPSQIKPTFYHMINVIRMLWDNDTVQVYGRIPSDLSVSGKEEWILNTYLLNTLEIVAEGKSCCLTGPASCGKSFGVSLANLTTYYSAPLETMAMISTTTGSASEARIWGEIKSLHRKARFADWGIHTEQFGRIIDYLKCITFDIDRALEREDKTAANRDLRNGLQVIPIPKDSKGDTALATIIGRKNQFVLWTIDELPEMMNGVTNPRANLQFNPFFQLIGIGNANKQSDPHGQLCEPKYGWTTVNPNGTKRWRGKTVEVLYLDGDESPNDSSHIDDSKIVEVADYPFPKLSNKFGREETAMTEGNGDIERGKLTIRYQRFAKGFWYGNSAENTVLSDEFVQSYDADDTPLPFTYQGFTTFAALDPGWTAGGDDNAATFVKCGLNTRGQPQIEFEDQCIIISPLVDEKDEYRRLVAREFVRHCREKKVLPQNACIDISGDGGLIYKAIIEEWKQAGVVGISSMDKSSNEKYYDRVTQYWFTIRELIATGYVRGFNLMSNYMEDLKRRFYTSKGNQVKVEQKKEMKKRIHRSPDCGDSFSYCCFMVMSKFAAARRKRIEQTPAAKKIGEFDFATGAINRKPQDEFAKDTSYV